MTTDTIKDLSAMAQAEPALHEHIDRVGIEFYSRWKEYILGDVINLKRGYDLPSQNRKAGSIPIFSSSGITDHHNVSMKEGPGVITGRYGTIGKVFYTDKPYWPLNTTLYVQNFRGNLPKYIFYFLQGLDFEKYSDKSAVPGVNRNELHKEIVVLPPLPEQIAIASILSSLDDKIDLLQRQNKTLEQLAETLFRQWFVEEAEELTIHELGKIATVGTGKGLKREEFNENGEFPILGANGEIGRTNKFLTDERMILTGRVGTLGKVYINENRVWISDNVLMIKPIERIYFYSIYFSLLRIDFENMNVGSTQPLVTQTDLKKVELSLPSQLRLEEFSDICSLYFDKINKNTTQIRTLIQTRDALLPKLMSGEVRVKMSEL